MTAKDSIGLVWKSKYILPDVQFGRDSRVVTATLRELRVCDQDLTSSGVYLELEAFSEIEFPCNAGTSTETKTARGGNISSSSMNAAVVETCGLKFVFEKVDKNFIVYVRHSSNWPVYRIISRLTESLQFVLARPVVWGRQTIGRRGLRISRLRPLFETNHSRHLHPPIGVEIFDQTYSVWKLFGGYLATIAKFPGRGWHPLSIRIFGVIEASEGSFDALALTLGTAVEGIAMSMLGILAPLPAEIAADVGELTRYVFEWDGFKSNSEDHHQAERRTVLKKRIEGLLGMLRRPRVNDIFQALKSQQLIDPDSVDAWKRIRHRGHMEVLTMHANLIFSYVTSIWW